MKQQKGKKKIETRPQCARAERMDSRPYEAYIVVLTEGSRYEGDGEFDGIGENRLKFQMTSASWKSYALCTFVVGAFCVVYVTARTDYSLWYIHTCY